MVYHENQGYIHKGIFIKKSKVIAFDFWSKSRRRYIEVNIQERGRLYLGTIMKVRDKFIRGFLLKKQGYSLWNLVKK